MHPVVNIHHKTKHEKKHYDLILLIIASHTEDYDKFKTQWQRYMSLFSNVKAFFLYSDPDIEYDAIVSENEIVHKHKEWYEPGILYKTFAGMQLCNDLFSYDYILRTNLSSFYHIPRLLDFLMTQPKSNYVAARQTLFREGIPFISGAGFIVSRDIVTSLLDLMYKPNVFTEDLIYLPDDVALSTLLNRYIRIDHIEDIPRYDCEERIHPEDIPQHIFHIRNKTEWKYGDRRIDLENMREQVNHVYERILTSNQEQCR
jgi:hypothetical protein